MPGGGWLTAGAWLGDATSKCTVCIIYPAMNINEQLSLTPGTDSEHQDCPRGCCKARFLPWFPPLIPSPGFLPSTTGASLGCPARVPSPGEGLEGSSGQPLAAPQGCRSSSCTSAAQRSLRTPCPAFPPHTGDFHRTGFVTIFSFLLRVGSSYSWCPFPSVVLGTPVSSCAVPVQAGWRAQHGAHGGALALTRGWCLLKEPPFPGLAPFVNSSPEPIPKEPIPCKWSPSLTPELCHQGTVPFILVGKAL